MTLLRHDPGTEVRSLAELAGIERALRREARRRYADLARRFERRGDAAAADCFHGLAARTGDEDGDAGPLPTLPPELAEPWRELADSTLFTPYRALAQAVIAAEGAFAYASYLAARAADPAVRREAERLASEALRHAASLRRLRREAWRRERGQRPPPARTPEDLARAAAGLLAEATAIHAALAARAAAAGETALADRLRDLAAAEAREAGIPPPAPAPLPPDLDPARRRERALIPLERLFELYEATAARAADEALLSRAQAGLETTTARLRQVAATMPG